MVEFSWNTQSPLQKALVPGLHGVGGTPGVELAEIRDIVLVQVMARRGKAAETAKIAKKLFGVEPPFAPGAVFGKEVTLIWSGPDQFLAFAPQGDERLMQQIADGFSGTASLSDQSDGRCVLRISGVSAVQAMAKFLSIDFDDRTFPAGAAAATSLDHTAANLWRTADDPNGVPVYHIAIFTSFADSLYGVIADSSLEYGLKVA